MRKVTKQINNRETHIVEFDNIRELKDYINESTVSKLFKSKQDSIEGNQMFTGTNNFDEALELLTNGWTVGSKRMNQKFKQMKFQNKTYRRQQFDVVGYQASVPRYLQGIPTSMVNQKKVQKKQRVITLTKAIDYSAGVNKDTIVDVSVEFLNIVREIEAQGIKTNINVQWYTVQGDEATIYKVKIKSANEKLNLSKMAFPLAHPSFLRRIMFRVLEVDERVKDIRWIYSYGMPAINALGINNTKKVVGKDEYYIPAISDKNELKRYIESNVFSTLK